MPARRIEVQIIGSEKSLQAALGRSGVALGGFQKKLDSSSRRMVSTGMTLNRQLTLPLLAVAGASAKLALDYGTAMNHVQALTGASAKQTQEWSDQILKLGPKVAQTPQQLAETLYFVASSGAKVNQVLPITAASAKLAAAGMGDAQTVAQLLTSAVNAYGPKALSAAKASNVLTEAIKVGKAEPADLATSLGRVIPIAQATGVTFAETAAAVAELTNTGLSADQAVTGVRAILATLIKPTSGAAKELHHLGFTVDELQQSVKQKGLLATMRELAKGLDGNQRAAGKLFPNVRALTAFLALTGKNAQNAAHAVDLVSHSAGAANKAFQTASHSARFQLNQSLSEIEANGIKLGNTLLPAIGRVSADVADLASGFSHLSTTQQDAILAIAGGAVALGPALTVLGNLGKVTSTLISGAKLLGATMAGTAVEVNAAGIAMTDLRVAEAGALALNPELAIFAAAVAGIAAIGLAVWASSSSSQVDSLAASFDRAKGAVDGLQGAINHLRDAQLGLKTANDRQTAAQIALVAAQNHQNELAKKGKKGTFEYRQAVNETALALDAYRAAGQETADAQTHLDKVRKHSTAVLEGNRQAIQRVNEEARRQVKALDAARVGTGRWGARTLDASEKAAKARDIAADYSRHMLSLARSMDAASGRIQASNPVLAANERKLAGAARAAGLVAQMINRIPTSKDIAIYLRTHEIIYGTTRVGAPPATTTGGATPAKPPGHSAMGGPIYAGVPRLVGEQGPEVFVPNASGRVVPNSLLQGPVEFVMTNWHEGRGYFRQIAGGVTAGHARRVAQIERMGG